MNWPEIIILKMIEIKKRKKNQKTSQIKLLIFSEQADSTNAIWNILKIQHHKKKEF